MTTVYTLYIPMLPVSTNDLLMMFFFCKHYLSPSAYAQQDNTVQYDEFKHQEKTKGEHFA